MSKSTSTSTRSHGEQELSGARLLFVGLEPFGAIAALDLARAGVAAIHVLDDGQVGDDEPLLTALYEDTDRGRPRARAFVEALARAVPEARVSAGAPRVGAGGALDFDDTRFSLVVVAAPADDLVISAAAARWAHAALLPSIHASLSGLDAVVGPLVVPGETACWNCCRVRQIGSSEAASGEEAIQEALLAARPEARLRTYLAPTAALLGHTLSLAVLDALENGARGKLRGAVLFDHVVSLEARRHAVLRLPRCAVCGGAFAGPRPDPAGNGVDIGQARDPDELMDMLAGVVDDRTGVITRVIVRPSGSSLDPELPIAATAMLARPVGTHGHGCGHGCEPELGAGKGTSIMGALITAVGEAVERYSAGRFDRRRMRSASLSAMTGNFLHPAETGLYAEEQYAEPSFPFVRLDPETPIDWVEGAWMDDGARVWVPALPTYLNYPVPRQAYFTEVTSNGLGGGPTLAAAALSAGLELVERDAFMISWLARRPGLRVVVDESVDPLAREAMRQLTERGVSVEVYLLDAGIAVPAVACVGYGDGERWPGATLSLSAHLCPRTAIKKALLEQGHIGPFMRRLVFDEKRPIPATPEEVRSLEDHALYYVPTERARAIRFLGEAGEVTASALPAAEEISLGALSRKVTAAGLRVAIVDVTSPDLGPTPFRVARALGPGFQQIHFGHGFARLANPRLLAFAPHGLNLEPHPLA